jgi:alcohol dehydrogenase class IV
MPQQVLRNPGALARLGEELIAGAAARVLVVTYKHGLESKPIVELILALESAHRVRHIAFSTRMLTVEEVDEVARVALPPGEGAPDFLIAIGGGSVIDLAKCLKLISQSRLKAREILSVKPPASADEAPILVAAPTTAGTGSEATSFATVYQDWTKHSADHVGLIPQRVVLDPTLLQGMPREPLLHSVLDALAQAMESHWSIHATEGSTADAVEAMKKLLSVASAWKVPNPDPSLAELQTMQEAAWLAGRAINASRTTLAHALSYPLTMRLRLAHGLAVFLNLARVIRFNGATTEADCADRLGIAHYRERMNRLFELFSVDGHEALARWVDDVFPAVGIRGDLEFYGFSVEKDLPPLLDGALSSQRSGNNPRRPSPETLAALFKGAKAR